MAVEFVENGAAVCVVLQAAMGKLEAVSEFAQGDWRKPAVGFSLGSVEILELVYTKM